MAQPSPRRQVTQAAGSNAVERREGRRVVVYIVVAIVVILIVGFLAGVLDNLVRDSVRSNVFLDNARDILSVLASTAPWIALFIILCTSWIFIADNLFVRWNRALGEGEGDKGVIYEIVHDNNAAAALILMIPMLIIALGLIYVALLNLPYNLTIPATPTK